MTIVGGLYVPLKPSEGGSPTPVGKAVAEVGAAVDVPPDCASPLRRVASWPNSTYTTMITAIAITDRKTILSDTACRLD